MTKTARRQFYVSFTGIAGYWATKTGGNVTSAVTKVFDGGSLRPVLLSAPAEADDVTIARPYDLERDSALVAALKPQIGRLRGTLVVQPADADLVTAGVPETYPDALLIGVTSPEPDAASGDSAQISLVFATGLFT